MREKMLEASKLKLAALEKQYAHRDMPITVTEEIARLQALIAKLERDYEVKS